jgi:hypothetical protein
MSFWDPDLNFTMVPPISWNITSTAMWPTRLNWTSTIRPTRQPRAATTIHADHLYEPLTISADLMNLLNELNDKMRDIRELLSSEIQAALDHLQAEVARQNGLDSGEIEIVRKSDGSFQFRRKLKGRPYKSARVASPRNLRKPAVATIEDDSHTRVAIVPLWEQSWVPLYSYYSVYLQYVVLDDATATR